MNIIMLLHLSLPVGDDSMDDVAERLLQTFDGWFLTYPFLDMF